jgi:hypothetical protein
MALTDENGSNMVMPVAPMYGGGNNGFADGFGGSGWWILLLFLLIGGNGWGGGFGGGMWGADGLYPWLNNSQNINGGFRDQMLNTSINGIQNSITSGFGDVQTALCGGFAGVNAGIAAAQNGITQQMYANQIADLERSFAAQTASTQGMNALQAQLAQCCCDNRAATADLKYTVATENCADRTQAMQNTRDIIDSQTRSTQAILDKLCALELDGVKSQLAAAQRENVGLQNQLNMATFAASQVDQTAQLRASQATTANQLVAELRSCPIPSQPVYGNQPIFTCGGSNCGCRVA